MPKRKSIRVQRRGNKNPTKKVEKEISILGKAFRGLGQLGGSALGNFIGQSEAGGHAGKSLGASISKWLGSGDYTVTKNSLVNQVSSGSIPMMHNTGQSITVRHREYIADVKTGPVTGAFNIGNSFVLNPGLEQSFPWLCTIAQQYQEYSWKGIVFHYVSTSGSSVGSTTTSLGSVMLHTDYRVTAPQPISKVELLNEYFASDAKPSENFVHPIECDPKENPYNVQYVRTGAVPAGEDPKTYDLGVVTVATAGGQAANVTVGELWVTYEIELKKPQVSGALGYSTPSYFGLFNTGISGTATLGTNRVSFVDNIGISIDPDGTITFPKGTVGGYALCWWFDQPGAAKTVNTFTTAVTNCNIVAPWFSSPNEAYIKYSNVVIDGGGPTVTALVKITDPNLNATVRLTNIAISTPTTVNLMITSFNPALIV
jgi:hypothetical protein